MRLMIVMVLFGLSSCVSNHGTDREREFNSKTNLVDSCLCDRVSNHGISFEFHGMRDFDSVMCFRNNGSIADYIVHERNEKKVIVIYDTFLPENEYEITIFSNEKRNIYTIEKIRWQCVPINKELSCLEKSCEINGNLIKAISGRFEIRDNIINVLVAEDL